MTPERWEKIKTLFGAALERSGDERAAFVEEACAGDPELQDELEGLLASNEVAAAFFEVPTAARGDAPGKQDGAGPISLPAGTRLGPYEIVDAVGSGGMGDGD